MDDPVGIPNTNSTLDDYNQYSDQEECVERKLILKWLNEHKNKHPYRSTEKLYEYQLTEKSYIRSQINNIIHDITRALSDCDGDNPAIAKQKIQATLNTYLHMLGVKSYSTKNSHNNSRKFSAK